VGTFKSTGRRREITMAGYGVVLYLRRPAAHSSPRKRPIASGRAQGPAAQRDRGYV
jgi:hypothetical protein